MKIDAYTHCTGEDYLKKLLDWPSARVRKESGRIQRLDQQYPQFHRVESRLADMDKYDIDMQVTMLHAPIDPNRFELNEQDRVELTRLANDDIAKIAQKSKGRIVCLGVAPLAGSSACKEEMTRAVKDLGLKGFMVPTNVRGVPADRFTYFWDQAAKLDVAVYVHPIDPYSTAGRPYEDEYDLSHVFGWPFETSLIFARLVFSGTMKRNPGLRVLSHHLGGMIPFLAGRINESYDYEASLIRAESRANRLLKGNAMDYFMQFYYDTAIGGNAPAIKCGLEIFGPKRIVFSTDYPWGPKGGRQRLKVYPKIMKKLGISSKDKSLIMEENVSRLLKL